MKVQIIFISVFLFSLNVFALEVHNRLEELFIWKISDELKLSIPEEKSFSELLRGLNLRRSEANDSLQENLKKMSLSQSAKERERLLQEQKRLLRAYNDLSLEEIEKVQKVFGLEKTAQYLVLKNDLTNRLKSMLVTPDRPATASAVKLAPPRVIEEK